MNDCWELQIGGVRGSAPATGAAFTHFGGDTLSLRLRAGGEVLYIDAGTGLLPLPEGTNRASVLIGHAHFDHLCGLALWSAMMSRDNRLDFYMQPRGGLDCLGFIDRLYTPPLWPVRVPDLPAQSRFHNISGDFAIGALRVKVMEGEHPNGVTHFRIEDDRRSVVYAVDTQLTPENAARIADFARGCDLLICDSFFLDEEHHGEKSWGHSSMGQVAALGKAAGAAQTLCLHYQPQTTDDELLAAARLLEQTAPRCRMARQGEVILL